jgi:deazaflavin-dependent oxidoreductase (nitroreductase family)
MRSLGAVKRWMYRGGRPHRLATLANRWTAIAASAGLPPRRQVTLQVRGRRTGRVFSVPVALADYDGDQYLVSMLGDKANWVRNVRAAGGRAVLRHGRRRAVMLEEVDPHERAPILRRYLQLAPGARPHIHLDQRAPRAEFERVAARYPVFRVARQR